MLSTKPVAKAVDYYHSDTDTSYTVKPLTAKRYAAIRNKCTKGNQVDAVAMAGLVAAEVIDGWKNVDGDAAERDTRIEFGEKFAFTIMPMITDTALEAATYIAEERAEAKKD